MNQLTTFREGPPMLAVRLSETTSSRIPGKRQATSSCFCCERHPESALDHDRIPAKREVSPVRATDRHSTPLPFSYGRFFPSFLRGRQHSTRPPLPADRGPKHLSRTATRQTVERSCIPVLFFLPVGHRGWARTLTPGGAARKSSRPPPPLANSTLGVPSPRKLPLGTADNTRL